MRNKRSAYNRLLTQTIKLFYLYLPAQRYQLASLRFHDGKDEGNYFELRGSTILITLNDHKTVSRTGKIELEFTDRLVVSVIRDQIELFDRISDEPFYLFAPLVVKTGTIKVKNEKAFGNDVLAVIKETFGSKANLQQLRREDETSLQTSAEYMEMNNR